MILNEETYKIIDNEVVKYYKSIVYQFTVSDYISINNTSREILAKWKESDAGKFVIENSVDPLIIDSCRNISDFSCRYAIIAKLKSNKFIEYLLKYN